jgi:hypothetical protein
MSIKQPFTGKSLMSEFELNYFVAERQKISR